ncbi:calcium-binding protein [Streptomyces sp. NRRL B-3648]|uniref:calcium-binding protein n=1 Tax=Streptomyces sp. NRRL B-3648 TaxID=1519493 RepID=UPI0006AFD24B|nr:calcium-binding protein [Streptomyces sp. NRRL B-3648]KOX03502.1 sarcoplasmic reticulum histidine-rich calcium-binding protein [Streptomyces sp. NRRL B-3648]
MRMRVAGTAVLGALALSVLAVPAAHAADAHRGDTKISNVVVNGGKPVVVSASGTKTITVSFTATDDSGIDWAQAILYHGKDIEHSDSGAVANTSDKRSVCTEVSATKADCKATYTLSAGKNLINEVAGSWKVWAIAQGNDTNYVKKENAKTFQAQRLAKLTADASPEPVKKGKTLTVTGALTRANWNGGTYSGYTGQSVKLQFRKSGSNTYTTLKTVKTDSKGRLKTTVKATADGYYRYSFAGTSTTSAVSAAGDFVDVK